MEKQLNLFEGMVLTVEQEEMVARFKENKTKCEKKFQLKNQQIEGALVEAGFVKGVDFENTFEIKTVTRDINLGSSWNNNEFTAQDITFSECFGGVALLSKLYDKAEDKVVDNKIRYFNYEGGKFECSSLTGNYRKIKPTTLLAKLQEQRERAEYEMKANRERNNAFNIALNDLNFKFPAVSIFIIDDYSGYGRSYRTYKRIKAQFTNGSYVTFSVNADGSYRVDKKYDANFAAMNSNEVMEFFTNQNK